MAPSPCILSEPTASPTPCLVLPMASLVAPLTLSAVLPIEFLLHSIDFTKTSPKSAKSCFSHVVCDHSIMYGSRAKLVGKQRDDKPSRPCPFRSFPRSRRRAALEA